MAEIEMLNRHRLRNVQRQRWMVNDFDMANFPGRSASQATRDYRVELDFGSIEFNNNLRS